MNIYDISKEAGVSIATVSRVLNSNARVSEKTRARVLAVMEKYNYTPNAFARGLGLNTMRTIGLMTSDAADPYLARAINCLQQGFLANGYDCLLCCTGFQPENRASCLELLLSKHVDGVVMVGSHYIDSDKKHCEYIYQAAKRIPIVLVNGSLDGHNLYSVYCDDYRATQSAVSRLLDNGSQRVLYLYHSRNHSGQCKLNGLHAAYEKRGLTVDESLIRYVDTQKADPCAVRDYLLALDKQGLQFDAIHTSSDMLALGAVKYARAAGRRIPEELSIIGYDNSYLALCCEPELTSVDNKLEALCGSCVSTLVSVLSGKETPQVTVFSAELAQRGSTRFTQ